MDLLARIAWRTAFTATVDEDLLVHAGVRMLLDVDCMTGLVLDCDLSSFAIAAAALTAPSVSSKRKRSYWRLDGEPCALSWAYDGGLSPKAALSELWQGPADFPSRGNIFIITVIASAFFSTIHMNGYSRDCTRLPSTKQSSL